MRRTAALSSCLLFLAWAAAAQDPENEATREWVLRGVDTRRGRMEGALTLTPLGDGRVTLSRTVRYGDGSLEVVRGTLELKDGRVTGAIRAEGSLGLADLLDGEGRPGLDRTFELRLDGERLQGSSSTSESIQRFEGEARKAAPPALISEAGPIDGSSGPAVDLHYLGAGGWDLRWGGERILIAPFFSNPCLEQLLMAVICPDAERIERGCPPVEDARAILVGHSHYDHLLDVPYVAVKRAPRAQVFCNRTGRNIVAGYAGLDLARVTAIDDPAEDLSGTWVQVPGTRIRFMPIRSEHAPHMLGQVKMYGGEVHEPQDELPCRAEGWKEGQTYTFLIDLLDEEGRVAFRIHYADAPATAPTGLPSAAVLEEHPVDLVILCAASFTQVKNYPEGVLEALRPRALILGHWEDFFHRTDLKLLCGVPFLHLERFVERVEKAKRPGAPHWMPRPGWKTRLAVGKGSAVLDRPLGE